MGEYTVCYWPCWPEPRPKAQRPPTRLAREVRSLGEQSSDSQGQYGPGVSAPMAAIPTGGIVANLPAASGPLCRLGSTRTEGSSRLAHDNRRGRPFTPAEWRVR